MLIGILDYIPLHSDWIFNPRSILLSAEILILSYCLFCILLTNYFDLCIVKSLLSPYTSNLLGIKWSKEYRNTNFL